jgi:O-antigen/teichoic acid export membrane protein
MTDRTASPPILDDRPAITGPRSATNAGIVPASNGRGGPGGRLLELVKGRRPGLAVRGTSWVAVEYGASQLFRLASTLVLARFLLGPEAFGLVAIVNVFLTGLQMLSQLGVGQNVVQHPRGDDPAFLDTAFTVQAARGLALWAAASALAYPLARFYEQPDVFPLALAAAVSIGLRGLASPSVWTLTRHVQRRRLAALTIAAETVGFGVAVGWAVASPSAWALVTGTLANATVFTLGSFLLPGHRVCVRWERDAARDLLRFGAWISVATAMHFLAGQGERLILGKFVTAAELGCFSVALMIATAPSRGIQHLAGDVFFPLIARRAREGPHAVARDYKRARLAFLAVSLFMAAGFTTLSHWLVAAILPPQYAMTGWMLQALGLRAAFDVFGAPTSALLLARGLSIYSAMGNMARLLFLAVGLYVAFSRFGLPEAVWVLAVSPVTVYFPAALLGVGRHFAGLARTELVSFFAFLANATLLVLAWRLFLGA